MINVCPFCGKWLDRPLNDGITSCLHCRRVFDSSDYHRLLNVSWVVRNYHISDIAGIQEQYDLTAEQANLIDTMVIKGSYSHDEFYKAAKALYNPA